jgi:hypothetical protein
LRYSKLGSAVMIHESDVDAYLHANARGGNRR